MSLDKIKQKAKEIDRKISLKTASQVVPEWVDNELKVRKNPMVTGFKIFDDDLRNNLRGKLGIFAGYGGSKKSLYALNLSCHNAFMKTGKAIYSTMEMSATNLLDRMIDYQFGSQNNQRATDYFRNKLDESNKELIKNTLQSSLSEYYGDRLLISQQARMKPDDYRKLLDKAIEEHGEINTLIVDGLSMMGGDGSEVEVYSENTAALKEIANEYNIFVGLIAHLSKGLEIDTRDVRSHIRGSQKILDNCDFVLMFSLIRQVEDTGLEVRKDLGFIRLYNKRGTGNTIDMIYNFNLDRLLLEETEKNPLDYPEQQQTKKGKW